MFHVLRDSNLKSELDPCPLDNKHFFSIHCHWVPYLCPTNGQQQIYFKEMSQKRENSRKSVRWSAVPVAPKLVNVRCEGERGSGPEGADDLCCFYLSLEAGIGALKLGFEPGGGDLSHVAGI